MCRIAPNSVHISSIGRQFLPANPAHDSIKTIRSDEHIKGLVIINRNVKNKIAVLEKKKFIKGNKQLAELNNALKSSINRLQS